jgi:hypothetical protein
MGCHSWYCGEATGWTTGESRFESWNGGGGGGGWELLFSQQRPGWMWAHSPSYSVGTEDLPAG